MAKVKEGFMIGMELKLLLHLYNRANPEKIFLTQFHRESGFSYAWLIAVVSKLHRLGLIDFDRQGRKLFIDLTKNGRIVCQALMVAKAYFPDKGDVI